MPIPAMPGRADIAKIARGDASALEQLYLWMDAVSRVLAQNGLGQEPVAPTSGGTVAWPPNEQPATSASGVVAVAVRFADGTFGYVDPDVFVNAQPSLGAYWRTDGSSSPSTGPWELEFDLTMSDGSEITLNAASPSSDQATITPSTGTWDNGATAMEISATGLVFSNNSQLGSLVATTLTGTRTWTLQNASGTIALLEVAQTWSAVQTSSVAKNYAYSAASLIGLYDVGVVFGGTLEYVTATTALNAVFLVPLPAGTVWTALNVKARRAAVGSGVTVSVTKRSATGSTVTLTVVDGPDTFSPVGVTTNTMTFASAETVAADTIYQIEVVFGASGGHLYDFEFITTSQPFA